MFILLTFFSHLFLDLQDVLADIDIAHSRGVSLSE